MQGFAQLVRRAAPRCTGRAALNAAARRMLTAGAQQSRKAGGWRYRRGRRARAEPRGRGAASEQAAPRAAGSPRAASAQRQRSGQASRRSRPLRLRPRSTTSRCRRLSRRFWTRTTTTMAPSARCLCVWRGMRRAPTTPQPRLAAATARRCASRPRLPSAQTPVLRRAPPVPAIYPSREPAGRAAMAPRPVVRPHHAPLALSTDRADGCMRPGLAEARKRLEPIKAQFPGLSYADLWILASYVAIEDMGGPKMPFRAGRSHA